MAAQRRPAARPYLAEPDPGGATAGRGGRSRNARPDGRQRSCTGMDTVEAVEAGDRGASQRLALDRRKLRLECRPRCHATHQVATPMRTRIAMHATTRAIIHSRARPIVSLFFTSVSLCVVPAAL